MKQNFIFYLSCILVLFTACNKDDNGTPPPKPEVPEGALPVVFHVLYEDPSETSTQNPAQSYFTRHIDLLNRFYAAEMFPEATVRTPVGVSFKLAETDPQGNKLAEPGIHRVLYPGSASMDEEAFLDSKHPEGSLNAQIFWDPNRYVNVWLFGFERSAEEVREGVATTGITTLPYSPANPRLPGLAVDAGNVFQTRLPPNMHGVALNNLFFTQEEGGYTFWHEMGHYLGLLHAFALDRYDESGNLVEPACADKDDASDDYCADTPKYNRDQYNEWYNEVMQEGTEQQKENLYYRTSCNSRVFRSTNIMDYNLGDRTTITPDQRERIDFVLGYSPLVPRGTTKAAVPRTIADPSSVPAPIIIR